VETTGASLEEQRIREKESKPPYPSEKFEDEIQTNAMDALKECLSARGVWREKRGAGCRAHLTREG